MFLFNSSRYARAYFDWSDSVGIGVDSWACARYRRWSNTTVMLFGSQPMSFTNISNADVRLDEGRPHVMIVEKGYIYCALRGPMPSPPDAASPDEDRSLPGGVPQRSGGGGGLASGPVAGIAVGAALAGVAAAAAVAFGYRRWVATRNRGGDLSGGGGGGGGGGGSGGGGGHDGGAGVPSQRVPASTPSGAPWALVQHPTAAGLVGPRAGPGGMPPPPYALLPTAAGPGGVLAGTPGHPAFVPTGLVYHWEAGAPGRSVAVQGGS